MRVTAAAVAGTVVEDIKTEGVETCTGVVTVTNITSDMDKSEAANVTSFASSTKYNAYTRGRFQSAGYLITCEEDIKPDPDLIQANQNCEQERKTASTLQEQFSKESSQPSGK